jgi:hypothetical protein
VFVYFPAVTYVLLHEFQFCFLGFRFPMIYKDFQGRKIFFIRVRRHSLCSSVIRVYPLSSYPVLCILSICTYRTLDPALSVDKLVYQDIFERLVILVRCHRYQCHRKFSSRYTLYWEYSQNGTFFNFTQEDIKGCHGRS